MMISILIIMFVNIKNVEEYKDILIIETDSIGLDTFISKKNKYIQNTEHILDSSLYSTNSAVVKNMEVELKYTDENMQVYPNLNKIGGRFFISSDRQENKPYAILDKQAAVKLFASMNCIGKNITIKEKEYTVIGIVDYKGFINRIINNIPTIYLPYQTLMDRKEVSIFIKCERNYAYWIANKIIQEDPNVKIYNTQKDIIAIENKCVMMLATFFILMLISTVKRIKTTYIEFFTAYKKTHNTNYFYQNILINKRYIMNVVKDIILLVIIIIVLAKCEIRIDPNSLPSSFGYYDEIKNQLFQNVNRYKYDRIINNPLILYLKMINYIVNIKCIIMIILATSFYQCIRKLD